MNDKVITGLVGIISGIIGIFIGKSLSEKKDNETKKSDKFYIFLDTEDFDKQSLEFGDFETANDFYDKLLKEKKVTYKDCIERNEDEYKIYEKYKDTDEKIPLTKTSKIWIMILEHSGEDLKRKEFNK